MNHAKVNHATWQVMQGCQIILAYYTKCIISFDTFNNTENPPFFQQGASGDQSAAQDCVQDDINMPMNKNQAKYPSKEDFPDFSKHNNHMAHCMSEDIYNKLRDKCTPSGYTLDMAIQTGVDNPGRFLSLVNGVMSK